MAQQQGGGEGSRTSVVKLFTFIGALFAAGALIRWIASDISVSQIIGHGVLTVAAFGVAGLVWYDDWKFK